MDSSPELWAFVLANTGLFVISSVLTGLSYLAYRQSDEQSTYLTATIGFAFVVLGGLVEPVYQFGISRDHHLNGSELLLLQSGEGVLIAFGLGLLFYAITYHGSGSTQRTENDRSMDEERIDNFDY